jgi:hypothetical protein
LASGDGSLFASFTCNYGKVISPFPRAGEEGILIQMTPERTRDEESVPSGISFGALKDFGKLLVHGRNGSTEPAGSPTAPQGH